MDRLTNALETVIKTAERKARPPADPPILTQMAVGGYTEVSLKDSGSHSSPYANQLVGLNDYQVVLPRETKMVVSDLLLAEIDRAGEGFEHEVVDGSLPDGTPNLKKVRIYRDCLNYKTYTRGITPQQAQEMREAGRAHVYPAVLDAPAQEALAALSAPETKKGK